MNSPGEKPAGFQREWKLLGLHVIIKTGRIND